MAKNCCQPLLFSARQKNLPAHRMAAVAVQSPEQLQRPIEIRGSNPNIGSLFIPNCLPIVIPKGLSLDMPV